MMRKQGITVTVMVITIIILTILAGTITVSTYSTINYSRLSAWTTEITYIQDVVNEEINTSSGTDYTLGDITINVEGIVQDEQFEGEIIADDNTVTLKILDLGKLKITNTTYGNLDATTDVYAISMQTGRVYYVQGIEIDGEIYYSLTDSLKQRFNLSTVANNLSSIVFVPSVIGYTNQPITVVVKVPNTYTNIVISTSNDEIQIGSQTVKETTYEYAINANQIEGNYVVTVSYNDGTQTLTSKYNVNGYDVTAPVIQELTDENFVYKQTDTAVIDYLINITATDENGIKVIKYAIGLIEEQEAREYFEQNGNVIIGGKINLAGISSTYTIYAEDNAGNFSILSFDHSKWVIATVDGVPIPKGFVASEATGESTKDGGLVIYEGTEPVTDENVKTAKRTRNQYVWVPVEDFSKFLRKGFRAYSSSVIDSDGNYYALGTIDKYWEVMVNKETNLPLEKMEDQGANYMTATTLAEVQEMYASVKEYKGFYIARYEMGVDNQRAKGDEILKTNVYSMLGKIPYTYIPWTQNNNMAEDTNGAVQVARSIYPATNTNYGVVSTLTYGVQWDRTLSWWLEVGAKDGKGNVVTDIYVNTSYGNYADRAIAVGDLNDGAKYMLVTVTSNDDSNTTTITYGAYQEVMASDTKASGIIWQLSTGALKVASVNNIYDMAGNVNEWTMEGNSNVYHVLRGGNSQATENDSGGSVSSQATASIASTWPNAGFRTALYIKK